MISKEMNLIKELSSSSQPVLLISDKFSDELLDSVTTDLKISHEQLVEFDPSEGVEQLRVKLNGLYSKPLNLGKKLFFIPHCEKLNIEQVNTLLKLLEEPPSYLITLLVSSSLSSVILTVRSRCKKIILKSVKNEYDREKTILDLLNLSFAAYFEEIKNSDRKQFTDFISGGLEELRKKMLNKDGYFLFKSLVEILNKVENTNVNHLLFAENLYIQNKALKEQ